MTMSIWSLIGFYDFQKVKSDLEAFGSAEDSTS